MSEARDRSVGQIRIKNAVWVRAQVDRGLLGGEVEQDQCLLLFMETAEGEHAAGVAGRLAQLQRAAAQGGAGPPAPQHAAITGEQRVGILLLRFDMQDRALRMQRQPRRPRARRREAGVRSAEAHRDGKSKSESRTSLLDLFKKSDDPNTTVEVNKYIWQASLEVLNFLPIQSVDPFSGVIVTGYGTPPGGGRAYRATIYVQDPALDARSLKVSLVSKSVDTVSGFEFTMIVS